MAPPTLRPDDPRRIVLPEFLLTVIWPHETEDDGIDFRYIWRARAPPEWTESIVEQILDGVTGLAQKSGVTEGSYTAKFSPNEVVVVHDSIKSLDVAEKLFSLDNTTFERPVTHVSKVWSYASAATAAETAEPTEAASADSIDEGNVDIAASTIDEIKEDTPTETDVGEAEPGSGQVPVEVTVETDVEAGEVETTPDAAPTTESDVPISA